MTRAAAFVALFIAATAAFAGGPAYVAGKSGFNAGLAGTPLRWAGNEIQYYTDQGNLSSLEQQASINALVADAFSRWISLPTVALKATRAGSLDEDVSGANVTGSGSVLTIPADIQPDSTKPMAFVYDADGAVTDALLGAGASKQCASNFVFGGPDRFTADAHIAHALIVLNGTCVKSSTDLPVLRYSLVRAIGRALGLDWSQVNDSVATNPANATADELAGYPVMHPVGALCTTATGCFANADQLRLDDRVAMARLYPVTADNIAQFTGKTLFASATARVSGTVWFGAGTAAVAIQGANVVVRLIDPVTHQPSQKIAAASVSGYLYRGNAGNIVTGYTDSSGQRYDRWGSDDASLRGYFELAGLEIPAGNTSATYQISVEPLNPNYTGTMSVGPFKAGQVDPPGTAVPITITVFAGTAVAQDITLSGTPPVGSDLYEPHSFDSPRLIPGTGEWAAALAESGDVDWHTLAVRADRVFSVEVTALSDGTPSTTKARPVIGLWNASAQAADAPLLAQTYFNAEKAGVTRAQVSVAEGAYKLAITDARGEGRSDFLYRARVLYADTVAPAHALAGTVLTVTGLGFNDIVSVKIGSADATLLSFVPGELKVAAPQLPDGTYALTVTDPATGASATINNAVRYGGARDDTLQLLNGGNPPVPVGTTAPNPFRVRVLAADGVTTVSGAPVRFVSPNPAVLLAPCDAQDCTVGSDGGGEASVWMLVKAEGPTTLTATISGGASVSATVMGVSAPLAVAAAPPKIYIAQGAAGSVSLLARVVGNGAPLAGRLVEYDVMMGAGVLSAANATTDANGEASVLLTIAKMSSEIRVSACVGISPQTACDVFYVYAVSMSGGTRMIKAGGDEQYAAPDGEFLPVSVRLNDMSEPPNVVAGAPVKFRMTAYKSAPSSRTLNGEVASGHFGGTVVVATEEATYFSNAWGVASYTPHVSGSGLVVEVTATSGAASATFSLHTWQTGAAATKNAARPLPKLKARFQDVQE